MGTPVSIDTLKPDVAHWALGQGARIVNDVWGLQRDPNMARVVGRHGDLVVRFCAKNLRGGFNGRCVRRYEAGGCL